MRKQVWHQPQRSYGDSSERPCESSVHYSIHYKTPAHLTGMDTMMPTTTPARHDFSLLTDQDLYLFNEGSHYRVHEKLGAHMVDVGGEPGTAFSVWAPAAREVHVIGDFNGWNNQAHALHSRGSSGIWEGFIPGLGKGAL